MVKSGLELFILKFNEPLQRYLLTCQANSVFLGHLFCTGQQQFWSFQELRVWSTYKMSSRWCLLLLCLLRNLMDQTLAEQNSKCIAKSEPVKDDALDWKIFSKVAFAIYFNLKINLKTYPFLRTLKSSGQKPYHKWS